MAAQFFAYSYSLLYSCVFYTLIQTSAKIEFKEQSKRIELDKTVAQKTYFYQFSQHTQINIYDNV